MKWQIDKNRSQIKFTVRHMVISKVRGNFQDFQGSVEFDQENPGQSIVDVRIDAASIDTGDRQRDAYLRSADFLDVQRYPLLTFVSRQVQPRTSKQGRLIGDLTIMNRTAPVSLAVIYAGKAINSQGREIAGFKGRTGIGRKAWGLSWNQALEAGGWLVGDKIDIEIALQIEREAG